ncbi:MAG: hypothetical protein IJ600_03495 [Lachnospiraceae bacterium]|nr:hypothetical protein [Lachnospiraceae bacterium]
MAIKVELNHDGVRELLRSPEMLAICEEYARKAVHALGEGYEVSAHTGSGRVNASVVAISREAIAENSANNTVLKAVLAK